MMPDSSPCRGYLASGHVTPETAGQPPAATLSPLIICRTGPFDTIRSLPVSLLLSVPDGTALPRKRKSKLEVGKIKTKQKNMVQN